MDQVNKTAMYNEKMSKSSYQATYENLNQQKPKSGSAASNKYMYVFKLYQCFVYKTDETYYFFL